jgi:glutathione S-transferase
MRLYVHELSGHSHRVRLFASLLALDVEIVRVDLGAGEHKQPAFLSKNPLGQVPVLEDDDLTLTDSNAINVYLASRYDKSGQWYPEAPAARARIQRWLSIAAGEIKNGPADARLVNVFGAKLDHERAKQIAARVLGLLEDELQKSPFLVGSRATLADVAVYSYVAHAPEGDVSLEPFPNVRGWLSRVEALPGFVPMKRTAVGLAV